MCSRACSHRSRSSRRRPPRRPSRQVGPGAITWTRWPGRGRAARSRASSCMPSASRAGDTLTVRNDVVRAGKTSPFEDRYVFDPPLNRWHVQSALGGFAGAASPWTGDGWTVQGENSDGVAVRMTNELLPGGDFRRTFAYDNHGAGWFPYSVERCTPGAHAAPGRCVHRKELSRNDPGTRPPPTPLHSVESSARHGLRGGIAGYELARRRRARPVRVRTRSSTNTRSRRRGARTFRTGDRRL